MLHITLKLVPPKLTDFSLSLFLLYVTLLIVDIVLKNIHYNSSYSSFPKLLFNIIEKK